MNKCQVIVVGAGPAGSSAAFYLEKAGVNVLMVDKESFPRDKPCGDGVSADCTSIYEDMGIMDEIKKYANMARGLTLYGHDEVPTTFGKEIATEYITPRRIMDNLTCQAAVKAGVQFIENYEATELITKKGVVKGVRGYLNGKIVELLADVVVIACGSHSLLSRQVGVWTENPDNVFYAARGYFENISGLDTSYIQAHYCKELGPTGYMWMCPEAEGLANTGVFVCERTLRNSKMRLEDWFSWWIKNTDLGKERLGNAKQVGTILGWRIPTSSSLEKNYIAGAISIGDAANDVDCWQGVGYKQALQSGPVVARELVKLLEKGDVSEDAMSSVYKAMCTIINPFIGFTSLFRQHIFKDPATLVDAFAYMREIPGYPNNTIGEAFGAYLKNVAKVNL